MQCVEVKNAATSFTQQVGIQIIKNGQMGSVFLIFVIFTQFYTLNSLILTQLVSTIFCQRDPALLLCRDQHQPQKKGSAIDMQVYTLIMITITKAAIDYIIIFSSKS